MATRSRPRKSYKEDSDASDEDASAKMPRSTKRKRTEAVDSDDSNSPVKTKRTPKKSSPKKRRVKESEDEYNSDDLDDDLPKRTPKKRNSKKKPDVSEEDDDEDEDNLELKAGQKIVGKVIEAPKTGRVPPGQISKNTFDFLGKLQDPKCNDREWFKLREPIYRLAENEWKDFVDAFTDLLITIDPEVPPLPPKDVIHRIYRDVRFSNDKTPYKTNMSASFSRSGRKGIFAGYHISIQPGNKTLIAAGTWCPGRNELATIRASILRNPRRLREVISSPDFVKYFGEPQHAKDGSHQNIFGMDDELKVAPKGVDKDHKDIDLLKCRSFAVMHRFLDSEVLDPNFKQTLVDVAEVVRPFVHCLNDMMTVTPDGDEVDSDGDE